MNTLWVILTGVLAVGTLLGSAFLGNWVSEEIRGHLDRLPRGLIRLAAHRLAPEVRSDVAEEWMAELHVILRDSEGLPITRLCRGTQYALGLWRTAAGIGRDLEAAPASNRLTSAVSWGAGRSLKDKHAPAHRADAWKALATEVVGAQERERARIAADLHDGPLQQVAAWRIKVEMISRRLGDDPTAARALLDELDEEVAAQAVELRRVMHELRPPMLDELGFGAAVRKLAEEAADRGGFSVRVDSGGLDRLRCGFEVETLAYRILQEVLTNVAKHAEATSATVGLSAADGGVRLLVVDDGCGMPPVDPNVKPARLGLASLSERVELFGGELRISSAPQQGTTVEAWLPARQADPDFITEESGDQ